MGDAVAASARAGEPDRYLAALLAPPSARHHLLALAAFSSELARVPSVVTREPMMGEIRLQWWRDALEPAGSLARDRQPDRRCRARRCARPRSPAPLLLDVIDARALDLADEPVADDAELHDYLWKSEGALFALAAGILGREPGMDRIRQPLPAATPTVWCGSCSACRTHCRAGDCRCRNRACKRCGVSREELLAGRGRQARSLACSRASARTLARALPRAGNMWRICRGICARPSFLWPWSRRICGRWSGRAATSCASPAEIAPLTRVWRIAMAHWLGRI